LVLIPNVDYTTGIVRLGNRIVLSGFSGIREIDLDTGMIKHFFAGITPGLPTNSIINIEIDSQGIFWFGSEGGLIRWHQNKWSVFTTSNSPLPSNGVKSLKADSTGIWIGTNNGVIYYDGRAWKTFDDLNSMLPEKKITAIAIDQRGTKWFGTWGKGVVRFDGINSTIWNMNGLEFVTGIAVDRKNSVWVATYAIHENGAYQGGGLHKFDGEKWVVYHPGNSGLPSRNVRTIAVDKSEAIWVAMFDWYSGGPRGLASFDGTRWQIFNSNSSRLSDIEVSAIFVDAENNKWFGIRKGINKFDGRYWDVIKAYFLSGSHDNPIVVDKFDKKWTADGESLVMIETGEDQFRKIDHFRYKIFNSPYRLFHPGTHALAIDSTGIFWIGGINRLIRFDGRNWTAFDSSSQLLLGKWIIKEIEVGRRNNKWVWLKHPNPDSTRAVFLRYNNSSWWVYTLPNWVGAVTSFAVDQSGILWIGTITGLVRFNGATAVLYNTTNSGLKANSVGGVFIDKANIKWMSVWGYNLHGVVRYDDTKWDFYSTHHLNDPEYIQNIVRCFTANSSGAIWMGTSRAGAVGTIMKFENNRLTFVLDRYLGPITNLSMDNKNNLWITDQQSGIQAYFDALSTEVDDGREVRRDLPESFTLYPNYPNPFNADTVIEFSLQRGGYVELVIYDIVGRVVKALDRGFRDRGRHRVIWDGKNGNGGQASSGLYYSVLSVGGEAKSQKLLLLK
jgi:ligand-binding sensor domain-containing protein